MARYTGPVCRLCRRMGEKLFLKGERCFTPRCAIERHRPPPGNISNMRRRPRVTDRGVQLKEKQKTRYIYGVLEKQFRKYLDEAQRGTGITGPGLLQLLETRLDNVVYRLSFVDSRKQARQLVRHGHFTINGRKLDIPSYHVKPDDVIAWESNGASKDFIKELTNGIPKRPVPNWLSLDPNELTGRVVSLPEVSDIDATINTRLIVEYYSK